MDKYKATDATVPGAEVRVSGGGGGSTLVHITVDAAWLESAMGGERHTVTIDIRRDDGKVARFFLAPVCHDGKPGARMTAHKRTTQTERRVSGAWIDGLYSPHDGQEGGE